MAVDQSLEKWMRFEAELKRTVPAGNFMATIAANVDNDKVSDADFREFIRNTLPIVQFEGAK